MTLTPYLIEARKDVQLRAAAVATEIHPPGSRDTGGRRAFGLLLVDGLSRCEERLAATLYRALGHIPIVGGSAGDDFVFERTHVYYDGRFLTGAAVFALFETHLPFATMKFHHFAPTATKLVITAAQPERRLVHEIDGEPAARAYAAMVGVDQSELGVGVFARHPLLLRLNGEYYVRSVQRVNADRSLTFYCAVETGLVLTLGRSLHPMATAQNAFLGLRAQIAEPQAVIACDSALRRVELESEGLAADMSQLLAENRVVGLGTYGEQYNAMHANQSFAGVALGRR